MNPIVIIALVAGAALLLLGGSRSIPAPTGPTGPTGPDPVPPTGPDPVPPTGPDPVSPPPPRPAAYVFEIRPGYFADNVLDPGFYYGPASVMSPNATATHVRAFSVGVFLTAQGAADAASAAGFAPVLRLDHFRLG